MIESIREAMEWAALRGHARRRRPRVSARCPSSSGSGGAAIAPGTAGGSHLETRAKAGVAEPR